MELSINEEFKELIPALQEDEKELLRQSLIEEGCRDSLITWNNTIIDGHNRYELCKKYNIPFEVTEMDFGNISEVKNWMIDNQLARRNLTDSQRRYFIGKRYEEEKIRNDSKGNQYTKSASGQSGQKQNTARDVALKNNTSERTVRRNKSYSKAIDEIKETDKEIAEKILTEKIRIPNKDVISMAEKEPEERKEIFEEVVKTGGNYKKAVANIRNNKRREELKKRTEAAVEIYEEEDLVEIVHKDCTEYLKTLEDNSVDLIVVDPPYFGIVGDDWDNQWKNDEDYLAWCKDWMKESLRVLKDTGSFYIWGSIGEKSDVFLKQKFLLDEVGLHFKDWITWKKSRGLGNRKGWLYTREECLWYVKDNGNFFWNEDEQYSDEKSDFKEGFSGYSLKSENKRITNVWDDIPEVLGNKGIAHYTPKPLKAIERIIKSSTKEGDLVLDFFGGSGTTGLAARNLNRKCILVEKDINSIAETKRRLVDGI